MTNLKKIFSIVGIVVVAGCGSSGGGGGGGGGTNHIIAGDWKSATIAKDGSAAVNCPGTLTVGGVVINECGVNDTILLRADLSFQEVNAGGSNAGTYAVSGNTITLTMTIKHGIALTPAEVTSAHFSITGNVLTIRPLLSGTTTENGETQTFTITNVVGATLAGTYNKVSIQQDGSAAVTCPGSTGSDSCGSNDTVNLTTGGAFTQTDATGSDTGTYTVSGNTVTVTINVQHGVTLSPAQVQQAHFSVLDTTIKIRPLTGGTTVEDGETILLDRHS